MSARNMTDEKPAVVLVPGAWLPRSSYDGLAQCLENAGHHTLVADLKSLDPPDPTACSIEQDAAYIREEFLLPLIEDKRLNVIVLMHSYGALGLGQHERRQAGLQGGVMGLISLCGFVLPQGVSLVGGQGGYWPPWILKDTPAEGLAFPTETETYLLNCMSKELAEVVGSKLRSQASSLYNLPQPGNAWVNSAFEGRRGYVMCREDQTVPIFVQQALVQNSGCTWEVVEIDGGHGAYIDRPSLVSEAIVGLIAKFNEAS